MPEISAATLRQLAGTSEKARNIVEELYPEHSYISPAENAMPGDLVYADGNRRGPFTVVGFADEVFDQIKCISGNENASRILVTISPEGKITWNTIDSTWWSSLIRKSL